METGSGGKNTAGSVTGGNISQEEGKKNRIALFLPGFFSIAVIPY
jgi:hypothetical protein